MEARNRIFAEHQLSGMRLVSRRVQKARECFRMRRSRRREVVAAVKHIDSADPRPFAKGCRELVETLEDTVQPYFSVVRTASGEDRSIIGRLELPGRYKASHVLPVSIPGPNCVLRGRLLATFGLAPADVGKPATRGVKAAQVIHASQMEHYADQEDEDEVREEPESWTLSAEEKLALGKVKEEFLTF